MILDLFFAKFIEPKEPYYRFEIAYALNNQNKKADAKIVYEVLLKSQPHSARIRNNLSNLCREFHKIDDAWEHIQVAYELEPDVEIIERNYQELASIIQEREEKEALFKLAIEKVENENDFVINKLSNFISNCKKDKGYDDGVIAIPKWKFKVLMGTDEQKTESLLRQWLSKNYVRKTGQRGQYGELVYELNPHLAKALSLLKPKEINSNWVDALSGLNAEALEEHDYFGVKEKISKIKKAFRENLERDIDELYINYILKNSKSVIILSGSVVELLLIYYLEKKKIKEVSYSLGKRTVNKKIYDADLSDLLNYCDKEDILKNITVHLGNISRLNRNYIHPGKELRENDPLNFMKANLCFSAALEILNAVTRK